VYKWEQFYVTGTVPTVHYLSFKLLLEMVTILPYNKQSQKSQSHYVNVFSP